MTQQTRILPIMWEQQRSILTRIAQGGSLHDVLRDIVLTIEQSAGGGMKASILLLSEDGQRLMEGAAPSLPAEYNAAIDGMLIGASAGSCGTAAFTQEPVFVTDIATNPLWADFRSLALQHGLGACWSVPIRANDGSLIGTFANYYTEPREPSVEEMAAIGIIAQTTSVAVERHRAELFREKIENRARLAMQLSGRVGAFETDLKRQIVYSDRTCADLHGVTGDPEAGMPLDEYFDAIIDTDRGPTRADFDNATLSGQSFDRSYRVQALGRKPRWVQSHGTVYRDRHGEPERLIGIVVDQTEQRALTLMQEARVSFLEEVPLLKTKSEIACLSSEVVGKAMFAHTAGIGTVTADARTLKVANVWSLSDAHVPEEAHRYGAYGDYADALRAGHSVMIDDVRTDSRIYDAAGLEGLDVRAMALVPLMNDHRMVAVMFVTDDAPRTWTGADESFIAGLLDRSYVEMDRLALEEERNMLSSELVHRMKNILTIAQVVVNQTLRPVEGLEDERGSISSRLSAACQSPSRSA